MVERGSEIVEDIEGDLNDIKDLIKLGRLTMKKLTRFYIKLAMTRLI